MTLNEPKVEASQAADTDEIMAEMLEAMFMKAPVVPPKRPPISVTVAQDTGSVTS